MNPSFPFVKKTLILIIDDESAFRRMLRLYLERSSYEVYEAENTEKAEDLLNRFPFDVVLCDWKMPGEDGLSFIRRFSSQLDRG